MTKKRLDSRLHGNDRKKRQNWQTKRIKKAKLAGNKYIIGIDDYIESFPRLKQMRIETEQMHQHLKDMNVLHDEIRELSKTSNSNSEIQVLRTKLNDMCNKCKLDRTYMEKLNKYKQTEKNMFTDIVLWELDV